MSDATLPNRSQPHPARLIVICSVLLMALIGYGAFFDTMSRIGLFYIFIISYFNALLVLLPIIRIRKMWVGLALYLPGAPPADPTAPTLFDVAYPGIPWLVLSSRFGGCTAFALAGSPQTKRGRHES